jgi:hypothetical protein
LAAAGGGVWPATGLAASGFAGADLPAGGLAAAGFDTTGAVFAAGLAAALSGGADLVGAAAFFATAA